MSASYSPTLRYWFDVEALMYPELPKAAKRPRHLLRYRDPLPWCAGAADKDDHKYFVYFGLVQKRVLEAELFELFDTDPEADPGGAHERPASGNTFLCAIEITCDGMPLADTLQLAAFAVAFAQRKHQHAIGWAVLQQTLKEKCATILAGCGSADADWFERFSDFLLDELAWQPREMLAREQLCAYRVALTDSKGKALRKPPEMDPINSFYLDDLARIRASAELGQEAPLVRAYLAGEREAGARTDVTRAAHIDQCLQPQRFPSGCWPSPFPLFLMQQVAVNDALAALRDGGMFSVNGPPGTGKTTLLMDVIAARVVERAALLARFDHPEQAFSKGQVTVAYPANKAGDVRTGPCFLLDEALLDCGIVVASANNKAVENITHDLPNLGKVHPQPLCMDGAPFEYFARTAEAILNNAEQAAKPAENADEPGEADEEPAERIACWGLVSVALGKKSNRTRVASQMGQFAEHGIQAALNAIDPARLDWQGARRRFDAARERVEAMQAAMRRFEASLATLTVALGQLDDARAHASLVQMEHDAAQRALQDCAARLDQIERQLAANLAQRAQYVRDWPWWRLLYNRVFGAAEYAAAGALRRELDEEYAALRTSKVEGKQQSGAATADLARALARLAEAKAVRQARQAACDRLEHGVAALRDELGEAAFDAPAFALLPPDQQHKSLPRSSPVYQAARADVFVAAMALHQAFMKHAGKPFETNLRLALAMLNQDPFIQPHLPSMARHLWATFFLTVPVVSSTFASVARCFRDLGEGEIGLLLVDEAGQAVPSHALGAIWRAKRTLIVGDPLQVEPVIMMDKKLDQAILRHHGAPDRHRLTRYSAQHLADRQNRCGAHVIQYDGSDLWVGSPLRVHRRCVEPMFSIANAIAYNDEMVFGLAPAAELTATARRPLLGPSRWIDIVANDFDEHFSPTEGRAAVELVRKFAQQDWRATADGLPDLYLISPFKSVAVELADLLLKQADTWRGQAKEEVVKSWLQSHVGTVHTFQGKEAESVILVLGGKSGGARDWAGARPNIINVAVTRAQRRLYVIGNKRAWSATTFGAALAAGLVEPA
ncbi:MAG: AAA domain-containing protein [Pseudomonadota bacterium]